MALKVLHLSTYATNGGAARAASALHGAMLKVGLDSRLVTAEGPRFSASRILDRQLWRLQKSPTPTWRSPARFASLTAEQINRSSADVVNLHWITDGFLSIEQIGKIEKPLVWSMYDMWPFSGTEHYGTDTPDARWRTGYTHANRPKNERGFDLDRWTYERKLEHWPPSGHPIHMVPASTWLEDATRSSALMANWEITRIPHVVDTDVFAPMDKHEARKSLGLPANDPIILFLASAGISDRRKGFDLLEKALPKLAQRIPNLNLAIAGPVAPTYRPPADVTIRWLGYLDGDEALRSAYCAADVLAAPSREDNMPLTAMEAQSCGVPVVAFHIGGLPDIVAHGVTGHLSQSGDTTSIAVNLVAILNGGQQSAATGAAARVHALTTWSSSRIVSQYESLYKQLT